MLVATSTEQPQRKPKKSVSPLLGIITESFFSQLSFGVIAFALPLYARQLGFSLTEIGVLLSFNIGVAVALKPFTGWVADRVGYRRGASAAIAFRSLLACLFAVAGSPWHLYGIQAARGVAKAVRDPAMHTLIASHGGKKSLASTFAWYQTAKGTAGSLGRALAGILLTLTASNFHWIFGVAAALSVLPLVTLRFCVPKPHDGSEQVTIQSTTIPHQEHTQDNQRWTTLLPFVGFGFLISGIAHMLRGLMPLLLVEYGGLSEAQAGSLYLIATLVALVSPPVFGWLHDHASRELVLMTRGIANVVSSVLYLVSSTFAGFAFAKVCDKIGTAAFQPAWAALMAEVSAPDRSKRAQRMGLMSAGEDAGTIVGPILAGFLWSTWGVAALMGVRIVLALISEVYTFFLMRSMARSNPAQAGAVPQHSPSGIVTR